MQDVQKLFGTICTNIYYLKSRVCLYDLKCSLSLNLNILNQLYFVHDNIIRKSENDWILFSYVVIIKYGYTKYSEFKGLVFSKQKAEVHYGN